jgi:hypothetical protein
MSHYRISSAELKYQDVTTSNFRMNILEVDSSKNQFFDFHLSYHAIERVTKRRIQPKLLAYVLSYGTIIQKQGFDYCILGQKEILEHKLDISIKEDIVAVLKNEIIITVYKSDNGKKHIKKKQKRLSPIRVL